MINIAVPKVKLHNPTGLPRYTAPCLLLVMWNARLHNILVRWLVVGCLLKCYVPETHTVISEQALTGDSVHSWQLYSASSLGDETTITITIYSNQ